MKLRSNIKDGRQRNTQNGGRSMLIGTKTQSTCIVVHFYPETKERQMFIENLIENAQPGFGYLFFS